MKLLVSIAAALIIVVSGNTVIVIGQENIKPPMAKKEPKVLKVHGYEITDKYAWLTESFMGQHKGSVGVGPGAAKADEETEQ